MRGLLLDLHFNYTSAHRDLSKGAAILLSIFKGISAFVKGGRGGMEQWK